jgi:hypothetical protein
MYSFNFNSHTNQMCSELNIGIVMLSRTDKQKQTGSLWCRRSQQSFNTSTRFYFPSFSLHVSAPTGHPQVRYTIGYFNGLFLIQRIRCMYATWSRDVTCCTSVLWLCSEKEENKNELTYWNFVAIDGIIRNHLDRCATGCNTQR